MTRHRIRSFADQSHPVARRPQLTPRRRPSPRGPPLVLPGDERADARARGPHVRGRVAAATAGALHGERGDRLGRASPRRAGSARELRRPRAAVARVERSRGADPGRDPLAAAPREGFARQPVAQRDRDGVARRRARARQARRAAPGGARAFRIPDALLRVRGTIAGLPTDFDATYAYALGCVLYTGPHTTASAW